jgi:hypothetical protein
MNKDTVDLYLPEGMFTITKDEYHAGRQLLSSGITVSDTVIRPNALINYIEEYNPTSIDTLVETEVTRKTRGMQKETAEFVLKWGGFFFMVLLGVGVLYLLINNGDAGPAQAAAPAASSGSGVTIN